MPVVLYGCETWSLTLREERRPRVFENRVLRVFVPKRDEVTGEWRKLHNEELNDLYSTPHIFRVIKPRRMTWARHVARIGRVEANTGFWWGNLRERNHLAAPGVDGKNNIKMDLQEVGRGAWTGSSWLKTETVGGRLTLPNFKTIGT